MAKPTNQEKIAAALARWQAGGAPPTGRRAEQIRAALGRVSPRVGAPTINLPGGTGGDWSLDDWNKSFKDRYPEEAGSKGRASWAKGIGAVGKALDALDTGGSYFRSKISTAATGIEEGDPTKFIGSIPAIGEIVNAIDNFGGDPNAPKGLLSKVIFADEQQEKDFWANTGAGEYLQRGIDKRGWQGTWIDNEWLKRILGFGGDVAFDPLTWVSGGAKVGIQAGAKGAAKAAGVELGEAAAEQGAKAAAKGAATLGREGAETATKTLADDAIKNLAEATAQGGRTKYKYARWTDWRARATDVAANATDPAEREWALSAVQRISKTEDLRALSAGEVARLGGKRALYFAGKPMFEGNKVVDDILRLREAAWGNVRRGTKGGLKRVFGEGTLGNQNVNRLLKSVANTSGDNIARALDGIETEKWARHTAGIEATRLGEDATKAVGALEKLGFDGETIFRAVQDERLFDEIATANPDAGQLMDGVRGVWRSMAGTIAGESGKVLNWGDTYAPHVLTQEAVEFLNSNPNARKGIPGIAAFEKARTLRSGQDDTLRLSKKQSTMFFGKEIPRNLSDAQLVDWINARWKKMYPEAPNLFETDIRKVMDRSVGNFASAYQKALFTTRMAERGWSGDDMRELAALLTGDPDELARFTREHAQEALRIVARGANDAQAQVNFVNDMERFIQATKQIGKSNRREWDAMVRELRSLKDEVTSGSGPATAVRRLMAEQARVAARVRNAEGDLAKLYKAQLDFLTDQIDQLGRKTEDTAFAALRYADENPLVGDLQRGGGAQLDAVRAANETAAQRARMQAEKNAPILASDRQAAKATAREVLAEVREPVSDILSGRRRYGKDPVVWGGQMERAQQLIRDAVERAGYQFEGFTENLSKVTLADLRTKVERELLEQIHGKSARIAGENAYQQRMLKGVSKEANKVLGPLGKMSDQMAQFRQMSKQIPNPARYELADLVGDSPKAAVLHAKVTGGMLRADILAARTIDEAVGALADLQMRIADLEDSMGLIRGLDLPGGQGRMTSFMPEPQTTGELGRIQRDAAVLAGEIADDTQRQLLEHNLKAGIAEKYAKALNRLYYTDELAEATYGSKKSASTPWRRTKNLSSKPTRQARQKVRDAIGARERAVILRNSGEIEDFVRNSLANTLRDSFNDLPTEIQNLFLPMDDFFKNNTLRNVLTQYDKLNNVLKAWLIAKPGFVFRNIFGGMFVNALAGVSPEAHVKMAKWWWAAQLAKKGRPGMWNRLSEWDKLVYRSVTEVQSPAETLAGSMVTRAAKKTAVSRVNPGSSNFFYLAGNQNFNEFAENTVLRGSMIADAIMRDGRIRAAFDAGDEVALRRAIRDTQVEATRKVGFFHFDYDKAAKSPFESEVLARIVPFYTYTKNVIPMLLTMMVERPKYFAWTNAAARNLQLGVPEDEVLPEYIRESGAIRTPFKFRGNRVYWMQDLPFNQLIDVGNDPIGFGASSVTPLLKTPIELSMGKQFYKRIPITSDMKESRFANTPALSQALSALGVQRTGDDGSTQFMRDDWQYALGQLVPPLYQTSNYFPATETQQLKVPTRLISDTTGIRLRVNTPEDQANELARRNIKERQAKSKKTREKNRGYSGG